MAYLFAGDEEDANDYKTGGYYKVEIKKVLNDRYLVEKKLGWGHFSTVWYCLDQYAFFFSFALFHVFFFNIFPESTVPLERRTLTLPSKLFETIPIMSLPQRKKLVFLQILQNTTLRTIFAFVIFLITLRSKQIQGLVCVPLVHLFLRLLSESR
jgi:hypothetical protein